MKKHIFTALLCALSLCAQAQRISRQYQNESLSKVLEDLNAVTSDYTIYFIYDELEDFTVTSSFTNLPIKEAIREIIGFYPMKVTYDGNRIFIECTQKEDAKVIGRVVDESGNPIEFANISLHGAADPNSSDRNSTYINGGVSNENGDFVIPCSEKRIMLKVTYVGYRTVTRHVSVGNIGTITLLPETYMVKGVEVKGEIPQYKAVQGGMTVDVQHSILHDVGTADDLLSMIPMIQGSNGKFEVLAKGEPEIYINNKKVRDPSELKQLKSVDIKSVDVITSPGAKYNAEVNAVIRIKTLKAQGDGLSLMVTSDTWKNNKWNNYDDLTLKYRTGGLEVFANVALDNGHYSNDQDLVQELHIKKDFFDVHADLPVRSSWTELQYKGGMSYDFNSDHSLGLSFSSQKIFYNNFKSDMTQNYLKNGAFYGDVLLKTDIDELDKPVWELNTYYVGKVGKLDIDLNATMLQRKTESHLNQQEYSQELGDRTITTLNNEDRKMMAGKLVLSYPVWKGVLSGGTEATSTKSYGRNFNEEGIIPETENEMKEKNIAGFAEYELLLGQWRLNAGLRFEHVKTDYYSFGEWQQEPSRTYNDWFPNLSAAWQKDKWGAQLSYSKRITRPPYRMLESMIVYDSRMFYEGGNPLLRPSVRQSIDLNLTYSWLTFVAGFTRENDLFTHIGRVYDEEKEIAIFQPMNFDHQDRVYATLVASPKLGFWQPTATLHYYQQMFDAEAYGAPKKLNKPEFSFDLKSWFVISSTMKALLQIGYTGSNHWAFMYRGDSFAVNARLQKSFFNERLSCTLYANDIFRTAKTKMTTYYAIGLTDQDVYTYTQYVGLTLSYNFNASRSKYKGSGAGNDERNRL
ncbi:MAG: TonB-dependent receptor family protein [Prevotella sp.]|nr:TonB-dependent receptor family protein [Prevotella sp.]